MTSGSAAVGIISSDIERFWRSYDLCGGTDPEILQREYLGPGTPGLQAFVHGRIGSAELLAQSIGAHPVTTPP